MPILDIARPVHEKELLQVRIFVRPHVLAGGQIAEVAVDELSLARQQEVDEQHGGVRMRRLGGQRHRGVGHRHRSRRVPTERCTLRPAGLDMRLVNGGRQRHLSGNHQVGQGAAGHRIDPDVLLAERAHKVRPVGHHHRADPVAGRARRCRDRHLALPPGIEQVLIGPGRQRWRNLGGVEADAGVALAHADPMAAGFDGVRLEIDRLGRCERLQDALVARQDETVGIELEGVDEKHAG
jgi:hypothetical protein